MKKKDKVKEKVKGKGLLKGIIIVSIIIVSLVFILDFIMSFNEFSRAYSWQNFYMDDDYNFLEILWTIIRAFATNIFVLGMIYGFIGFLIVQIAIKLKKLLAGIKKSVIISTVAVIAIIGIAAFSVVKTVEYNVNKKLFTISPSYSYSFIDEDDFDIEIQDESIIELLSFDIEVRAAGFESVEWNFKALKPGTTFFTYEYNEVVNVYKIEVNEKLIAEVTDLDNIKRAPLVIANGNEVTIFRNEPLENYSEIDIDNEHVKFIESYKIDKKYYPYAYKFEYDLKGSTNVYFNKSKYDSMERRFSYSFDVIEDKPMVDIYWKTVDTFSSLNDRIINRVTISYYDLEVDYRVEDSSIVEVYDFEETIDRITYFKLKGLKPGKTYVYIDYTDKSMNTTSPKVFEVIVDDELNVHYIRFKQSKFDMYEDFEYNEF